VAITAPKPDSQMRDQISVQASAPRGVFRFEIWLNGYLWSIQPGAAFSATGQVDFVNLPLPLGVPDGVMDIVVVAKDDLGTASTAAVTAVRGEPCTSAETCLAGQRCETGRCFWDPPVGEFGDTCRYSQFCKSGVCVDSECTETCSLETASTCADGYTCVYGYPDDVCRPGVYSSGCSSSRGAPTALVGFMMLVAWRRRRSRPSMARRSRARSSTS
jgi:MYXO-CTERM domain-containing protein